MSDSLKCPDSVSVTGSKAHECVYGENAWQTPAALYDSGTSDPLALSRFELAAGDSPSFNNWCDVDRLLQTTTHLAAVWDSVSSYVPAISVAVKHGNACGASVGLKEDVLPAMLMGDPLAVFGGVVMCTFAIDDHDARLLREWGMAGAERRILDCVAAPGFSQGAVELLTRKKGKCRLLLNPALSTLKQSSLGIGTRLRQVRGGFLVQPDYKYVPSIDEMTIHTLGDHRLIPWKDVWLAWAVGSTSNSNTITLTKKSKLIGNAVGQQDRVGAVRLALARAQRSGHSAEGSTAYSDSFFPFLDGVEELVAAGVKTIVATSGSVRDGDVSNYCKQTGTTLIMIPDKVGRGFFGH